MTAGRKILHVDMDAFYASIEQRDDPSLRGRPVVVGGESRGVVAAASYESRQFGIRSAMPMRDAIRRCPDLVRVPVRMAHYKEVSRTVFAIFREFTPLVEGLSLDEGFLDVSSSLQLFGDEVGIAKAIKQRIFEQTALAASVGVAPNKLVAKIASDLNKPDGLCVVTEENLRQVLDPLPVRVIPGIGPETGMRLQGFDIRLVGDLRRAPQQHLDAVFGRFANRARERASGIDDRPVVASRAEKSISAEHTFARDLHELPDLKKELLRLSDRTAERLRDKGLVAGTVQIKIRESDFSTYTRQRVLRPPGNGTEAIYRIALGLLNEWRAGRPAARLRLLGVGGTVLSKNAQQDLFATGAPARNAEVDEAVDKVRSRFGELSLGRARTLDSDQIR